MKKAGIIASICMLLACMTGCAKDQTVTEKDRLVAINATTCLYTHDYDSFYVLLDIDTKERIKPDELRSRLEELERLYGTIEEIDSEDVQGRMEHGQAIVQVPVRFTSGWMEMRYTINDSNSVTDFSITTSDKLDEDGYNETVYDIKVNDGVIQAICTRPNQADQQVLVVLIHGKDALDRNSTIGVNKVFKSLAYYLADNGVTVIRYDRSILGSDTADSLQVIQDELTALKEQLGIMDDLKDAKVYLLGYDLGGYLLPYLSQAFPADGYIISSAMSGPLYEQMYEEAVYKIEHDSSVSSDSKETQLQQAEAIRDTIASLKRESDYSYRLFTYTSSFWISLQGYEGYNWLDRMPGKVLITQGSNDFQVDDADYNRWKGAAQPLANVTCKYYKNMNHILGVQTKTSAPEDYLKESTLSPAYIKDLVKFVKD